MLAVLAVGLLPVLLLALLAAVEEELAPCAPQGHLALRLFPPIYQLVQVFSKGLVKVCQSVNLLNWLWVPIVASCLGTLQMIGI